MGSNYQNEMLERDLDISRDDAEKLKLGQSVAGVSPEHAGTVLAGASDEIYTEIYRSFDYFKSSVAEEEVDVVILSGGAALIKNFPEMLAEKLGVPVELADPFRKIKIPEKLGPAEDPEACSDGCGSGGTCAAACRGQGMIRINLLTEKRERRRFMLPQNAAILLLAVNLAALVVSGSLTVWVKSKVAQLTEQSEANKSVIGTLTKKISEINKIDKLNKELEERSTLIEVLRKKQSVPVRILDEVSQLIPDGVWASALFFKDNVVSFEGTAFTNTDIVSFMDNLKRSADLDDVYLEESRKGEDR